MEQSSEKLQKEAYVILSKKKKKRQKIRGREFRLITVTEGMMPIGM